MVRIVRVDDSCRFVVRQPVLSQFAMTLDPNAVLEVHKLVNGPPTDSFWSAAARSRALESCGRSANAEFTVKMQSTEEIKPKRSMDLTSVVESAAG